MKNLAKEEKNLSTMPVTEEEKNIRGVSPEEKERLIQKHGAKNLKIAELNSDTPDPLEVIIKKPSRYVIDQFGHYANNAPGKARDILINNCLLSHKEEVMADDRLVFAATNAISELVDMGSYRLKNL